MTAQLHVTNAYVPSVEHDPSAADGEANHVVSVAHAVARPVVDGLESSVCGLLVSALADLDWAAVAGAQKCEECRRIAG